MRGRAVAGACVAVVLATSAPGIRARTLHTSSAGQASQMPAAQPATPPAPDEADDDLSIAGFLQQLERVVLAADAEQFSALEGPLGNAADALAFANAEMRPGATRVVVQERDRQELSLVGIPGAGYALTVDAFIEFGNQARVATWQFYIRRAGDSWGIIRQQIVSSVDNLFRLNLNTATQFDARNLVVRSEDLELTLPAGSVFTVDTDFGTTGLVMMGQGTMRFAPAPENEKGQVRIFGGAESLEARFDAAFVRVGSGSAHYDRTALLPRPVDPRDLRRAQQVFKEESPKSFAVDLADLTREPWTLLPAADDFLAEIRTRRFSTLTYARSAGEPEDISLFDRRRKRTIALYASTEKLRERGRFYNEDDLAAFDVLDYDIDVTVLPDRAWIDGRAKMRIKVRASSLGQLTLKLADQLVVRSIVSENLGRLFNLRVTNQNTVLVNLPSLLMQDAEMALTVTYSGRLEPQSPDRETLAPGGQDQASPFEVTPQDITAPTAEPSYLYSNRSYWYPQSPVTDYATANIRLTVPAQYGCVATGEPTSSPEVLPAASGAEVRKACTFRASRPARYLSFIVSRLVMASDGPVAFGSAPEPARAVAPDPVPVVARVGAEALPTLDLRIQANPRQARVARQMSPRVADIIRFYRSLVSDSPYPSFTIALVENSLPGGHSPPYFAQLNQPVTSSSVTWRNDPAAFQNYPEFFVAHEVAHQWWGHGVGWENYHEQWISEGFAQYFAALYARHYRGEEVFRGILRKMRDWAIEESGQGPVHLGYRVGHIRNDGRAFRAIVYDKGAMVLHMLRQLLGDDVFLRGLQRFYLGSRFRKVGTEDFRVAMEVESGQSLSRFFERWIYGAGLPRIVFSSRIEPDGRTGTLRFEQEGPVYDTPVTVTLSYADGPSEDVVVVVREAVVEQRVPLRGRLRSAAISRNDAALAEYVRR